MFPRAAARAWVLSLFLLGLSHATENPRPPLRFLSDINYPPMTYLEDGVARGLEVDLARELTRVMGREILIDLTDWGLAQKKLLNGEVDGLIAMTITDERKKIYDFTIPTFTHEFALFVRKEDRRLNNLNSLEGKRVGVTPSGFPRKFMEARKGVVVVPTPTYESGMDELAAGKIDAFAGDLWVGAFVLRSRHIPDITIAGDSFARLPSGFAIQKGNTALVAELNAALRELEKEGIQKKIQKIW
ncbi:MAG: transporter substrate-binding domain-containing protein, partial [Spirochaetia bacterium]|nr:transporter substrate-binding domain-containing protein [Spirochaetia bacterium]